MRRNRSKSKSKQLPDVSEYEKVGQIDQLLVYPIKACEGVLVKRLIADLGGLRTEEGLFDRSYCILNKDQKVLNSIRCRAIGGINIDILSFTNPLVVEHLRSHPNEQQQLPNSCQTWLKLHYPIEPKFGFCLVPVLKEKPSNAVILKGSFTRDEFEGIDCGDRVSKWLELVLDIPEPRLLQFVNSLNYRPSNSYGKYSADFENEFKIMYQNYCDLHLICRKSVDALNQKVKTVKPDQDIKVSGLNFRPNLIVSHTIEAWHEDNWAYVMLGECVLEQIQNCFRCNNTTVSEIVEKVSQMTGVMRHKLVGTNEPLNTLKQFRRSKYEEDDKRVKGSPFFGCLLGTRKEGTFQVGDPVLAVIDQKINTII